MPGTKLVRVSPQKLRELFNSGQYYERVQAGQLLAVVGTDRHPSAPAANEPFCTRSQIVYYYDVQQRRKVAIVHQYLRRDGSIGASGRPDPKRIRDGDTIYTLKLPSTPT